MSAKRAVEILLDERHRRSAADVARLNRAAGDRLGQLEAAVDELASARIEQDDRVGACVERTELLRWVIRPLYRRLGAGEPPSLLKPWPEVTW